MSGYRNCNICLVLYSRHSGFWVSPNLWHGLSASKIGKVLMYHGHVAMDCSWLDLNGAARLAAASAPAPSTTPSAASCD